MTNLVDVPGIGNTTSAFRRRVIEIADDLAVDANFLLAIMSFETGGTFSPAQKNLAGSGAVGLIQFMPKTAIGLGTSTAELAGMTATRQLDFVRAHFRPFTGRLRTIQDCYMAVLMPSAVGKGPDHVLFKRGTIAFKQNRGLDLDGNGEITVAEAAKKVSDRLGAAPDAGPTLQIGDQGPEVSIIQEELVDLGYLTDAEVATGPGLFGPRTDGALKSFQTDIGMIADGIYDLAEQLAIKQLNDVVQRGSEGGVVAVLQQRLVRRRLMTAADVATGPGIFGPRTQKALLTFQMDKDLSPTGILTDETYRALFKNELPPAFERSANNTDVNAVLPERGVGFATYSREPGGVDQFGTQRTINAVVSLAHEWSMTHPEVALQFGDISRRGGGVFKPHKSHRRGRDVDMRPIRKDSRLAPTNIDDASFDRNRTEAFVRMARERHPNIDILFNDRTLVKRGLTRRVAGHGNHLHLRFS